METHAVRLADPLSPPLAAPTGGAHETGGRKEEDDSIKISEKAYPFGVLSQALRSQVAQQNVPTILHMAREKSRRIEVLIE